MAQSTHRFTTPVSTAAHAANVPDASVPAQRGEPDTDTPADTANPANTATPVAVARAGIDALTAFGDRLHRAVAGIDDEAMRASTALPGWTRAHLVSHLARNADALCNLLSWARTDVEQHAYASDEDRDADIAEGARRLPQVIKEDLTAAHGRFLAAATAMPDSAWRTVVGNRHGNEFPGYLVPWVRMTEEVVHLVDLDVGETFAGLADLGPDVYGRVIGVAVDVYRRIPGTPRVRLRVEFGAEHRDYDVHYGDGGANGTDRGVEVGGAAPDVLGWLTGRADGAPLSGAVPALPGWLR